MNIPVRYLPKVLTRKDRKQQRRELKRSRAAYKKGKYIPRKKVKSFRSKKSEHIARAEKMYNLKKFKLDKTLAKRTRCKLTGLEQIMKKGQGAYYSSGSRPNQTAHSWGYARLASSVSGGKASAVDNHILEEYCGKNSPALKLSRKAIKRFNHGTRRVPKVKL
jgi:hypothetical protein